ncbi:hypothetical protein ACIGN6_32000 [Streptomyces sp. NPDC053792]|uniref:hypothetical protein n=1 Tax=Streptomyces sp. NPDC053792 TaxID=3365716 RepID=UPI0037CF5120
MNPSSIAHTLPQLTNCPVCSGSFESCRCGDRPSANTAGLSVRAGVIDDIEREDNKRGFEPEDLTALHYLVRDLVAVGDRRAGQARLQARRTLGHMVPGRPRRELLTPAGPVRAADDACPICAYWRCRCGEALAPVHGGSGSVLGE